MSVLRDFDYYFGKWSDLINSIFENRSEAPSKVRPFRIHHLTLTIAARDCVESQGVVLKYMKPIGSAGKHRDDLLLHPSKLFEP